MPNTGNSTGLLLQMRGIDKSFPGVHALKDVSLELRRSEVLALVGENGAGKSTLIKVLGGAHLPDGGEVLLDGRPIHIPTPTAAQQAGVSIIYQEFNLVPDLTVRENIFLGRERTVAGFVRASDERREAQRLFEKIGLKIREAEKAKVPFMFVVGEREAAADQVAIRRRGRRDLGARPSAEAIGLVLEAVREKTAD